MNREETTEQNKENLYGDNEYDSGFEICIEILGGETGREDWVLLPGETVQIRSHVLPGTGIFLESVETADFLKDQNVYLTAPLQILDDGRLLCNLLNAGTRPAVFTRGQSVGRVIMWQGNKCDGKISSEEPASTGFDLLNPLYLFRVMILLSICILGMTALVLILDHVPVSWFIIYMFSVGVVMVGALVGGFYGIKKWGTGK